MSNEERRSVDPTDDSRIPVIQPWLKVMGSAVIPLIIAAFVPQSVRVPLAGVAVVLVVVGLVMLLKEGLFD